jgi:hypothetical protein
LENAAKPPLAIGLGFFVAAALVALLTNMPRNYEWPDQANLRKALTDDPVMSEGSALKKVALTRLDVLSAARLKNEFKGKALIAAMGLEVIAVGAVAVAIAIVIL